jgi:hypothetical protein
MDGPSLSGESKHPPNGGCLAQISWVILFSQEQFLPQAAIYAWWQGVVRRDVMQG